jgi:hypothetical protein
MADQTRLSELQSLNVDEMTLGDIESYCTELKEIAKVPELKLDAFQLAISLMEAEMARRTWPYTLQVSLAGRR